MKIRAPFLTLTKMNKIILYLTYSDVIILSAWGLITPFTTLYVTEKLEGGSVVAAGIGVTIYIFARAFVQMPIAFKLDQIKGEKDDYNALLIGSLIVSISAFLFALATHAYHTYFINALNGVGLALTYPSFYAIFSRHVDKDKAAIEWGLYDTTVGLASALTAALGGFFIQLFDYRILFVVVGVLSILGMFFIVGIRSSLYKS